MLYHHCCINCGCLIGDLEEKTFSPDENGWRCKYCSPDAPKAPIYSEEPNPDGSYDVIDVAPLSNFI